MTEKTKVNESISTALRSRPGVVATLTLNPSADRMITLGGELKTGSVNRTVGKAEIKAGGKGINVARALKGLGCPVISYFPVGGETGEHIIKMMRDEGMAYRTSETRSETRVNVKLSAPDGKTTEINEPGGPVHEYELEELLDELYADFPIISCLIISGSIPDGVERVIYNNVILRAKGDGIPVIVDTSGDALLFSLPAYPDLIKPNADELSSLTGREIKNADDAIKASEEIYGTYGITVLCTLGADGSIYVGDEGKFFVPAKKTDVKATTGAGDTYLSGFVDAIFRGDDIETAMKEGAEYAAMIISK